MGTLIWRWSAALVAWGFALTATLSVANSRSDWGHSVCGPWGCGPPLQALVACHAAWIVVLVPPTLLMRRRLSPGVRWKTGWIVVAIGMVGIIGLGLSESLSWLSHADEWQRRYLPQRIGFKLVTLVDVPLMQLVVVAVALLVRGQHRRATDHSPLTSSASPEPLAGPSSPAL